MPFSISNAFAQTMVALSERNNTATFETQFQQMQKTVINRSNKEIGRLEEEFNSTSREREALAKKANGLVDNINRIQTYLSDNQSNFNRLEDIITKATQLQLAFGTDGDSDDVTATDIAAFETLRDELYNQVNELRNVTHPDVVDPYAIINLKKDLSAIQALSPEIGNATDTTNQEISDYLSALVTETTNAMDAVRTTISMSSKLSLRMQSALSDAQIEIETKDTLAQAQLAEDIDNVKIEASNLLQAISLTYDAQAYTSSYLSNTINNGIAVPPNSILNIFT